MSEREDEWSQALPDNGPYDREKAKRAGEAAVSYYMNGLKKTERILWVYLTVCVALAAFCGESFLLATGNKALIGYGILFLVAIETTILMKLWYWIVNTRLTLQKEIRQSQLQKASPEAASFSPTWWLAEMSLGRPGLSPWERRAWFVVLLLAGMGAATCAGYSQLAASNLLTLSESVKLAPDGTSSSTMNVAYQPRAGLYVDSFPLQTGCLRGTIRWQNERGQQLPFDVSTEGSQRRYTVYLTEPIPRGDWLRYTQIREIPQYATREGDLWTYQNDLTYGCSKNRFLITVELPRGAKVVTTEPQPTEQSTENDVPKLVFSATRERNERFACKIQYQFADKAPAKTSAP